MFLSFDMGRILFSRPREGSWQVTVQGNAVSASGRCKRRAVLRAGDWSPLSSKEHTSSPADGESTTPTFKGRVADKTFNLDVCRQVGSAFPETRRYFISTAECPGPDGSSANFSVTASGQQPLQFRDGSSHASFTVTRTRSLYCRERSGTARSRDMRGLGD